MRDAERSGRELCGSCGAELTPAPASARRPAVHEAGPESGSTPQGERRQLTVLFCDLVGSTPLSQQLDAEEMRYVVAQYQKAARTAVELWGGHAKELGDGLLVYFGWPDAREDDPERAIRAGRPCAFPRVRAARRVRRSASIVATASPVSVAERTTSREDRKK